MPNAIIIADKKERLFNMQDVNITFTEGRITLTLPGELDHHAARPIREAVDGRLYLMKPSELVMDFSKTVFMDSSGIGLILGRVEAARAVGATVSVTGLSPTLLRLVRLAGLEKIDNLYII
jgi:stage II sporulation protein AA (anti-sigma F factor antagonist)